MMGVTAGLMQGRTGVFAEWMQRRLLYVLGYSASVFGNSVSMLIAALGLLGHSNGYQATVAIARNNRFHISAAVDFARLQSLAASLPVFPHSRYVKYWAFLTSEV